MSEAKTGKRQKCNCSTSKRKQAIRFPLDIFGGNMFDVYLSNSNGVCQCLPLRKATPIQAMQSSLVLTKIG